MSVADKIIVYQSELDRIAAWAALSPRIETGGDLFGYRTRSGIPVVTVALGPGPKARHEVASFFQDTNFLKRIGTVLNQSHGLQYIGEWHSHHKMGLAHPSGGDCDTVSKVFETQPFDDFFLCIVNLRACNGTRGNQSMEVTAGAFHFVRSQRTPTTAAWVVLETDSPVAAQIYSDPSLGLRSPQPQRIWTVPRTTLDAPSVSPQRDPLGGLMNSSEGNTFFRTVHDSLQKGYGPMEMRVSQDGAVSFLCRLDEERFTLNLPNGFPALRAKLVRGDEESQLTRFLPSANALNAQSFLSSISDALAAGRSASPTLPPSPPSPLPPVPQKPPKKGVRWAPIAAVAVLAIALIAWQMLKANDQLTFIITQAAQGCGPCRRRGSTLR